MLKLPKSLQKPNYETQWQKARSLSRPLFDAAALDVPHVAPVPALLECLRQARQSRRLVGGLEAALTALEHEREGLNRLKSRGQDAMPRHVTRVLLICNGGSPRFLREAQRAAQKHAPRLAVLRLDLDPEACGRMFFGSDRGVKALFIDHKTWTSRFFQTWLEECETNG